MSPLDAYVPRTGTAGGDPEAYVDAFLREAHDAGAPLRGIGGGVTSYGGDPERGARNRPRSTRSHRARREPGPPAGLKSGADCAAARIPRCPRRGAAYRRSPPVAFGIAVQATGGLGPDELEDVAEMGLECRPPTGV
ncbi:hypothetical protein ABZ479_13950 [Streptomyces sp. NPDC005722]